MLVLSTNPQRAVHRYPTGSSSCTAEVTVSLIIPFPQRNFLYFLFSLCFAVNAVPRTKGDYAPAGREQKQSGKCQETGGRALSTLAIGQAEVGAQGGKVCLCLVIQR